MNVDEALKIAAGPHSAEEWELEDAAQSLAAEVERLRLSVGRKKAIILKQDGLIDSLREENAKLREVANAAQEVIGNAATIVVDRKESYKQREKYACKVCGNVPDEYGTIEHGKGCFVVSEDGGGSSFVEMDGYLDD